MATESSFIHGLHAQFGLPRAMVVDLAERVTSAEVADVRRVVRGYDNEVYAVDLAGGTTVYPRIRRPGAHGAYREGWAMDRARAAGIPVPEVLAIEVLDTDEGERQAMVVAAAPGRYLEDVLPGLARADRVACMTDLGRTLARLHEVSTPGVWRPNDAWIWPDPEELRRGFVADRLAERPQLLAAGLSPAEVRRTLALIGESPDRPARGVAPVLCHGDISPDHVFVDGELRVCGLIDWGMWHGGSMIGELAYVTIRHDDADTAAILAGYGAPGLDDPEFRRAIALSVVNQLVGHIAHHVDIGDTEGLAPNLPVLRRALADLDA